MDKNTENMLAGKPYRPGTPELNRFSHLAHRLCRDYNLTTDEDTVEREMIIDRLFPQHDDGIYLQGPIHIDYGRFTKIGKNFYANFNFTILDTCPVTIGDNVMCGSNVSIITACILSCISSVIFGNKLTVSSMTLNMANQLQLAITVGLQAM